MVGESKIKYKSCSLRANAVIVCWNWKLIDKCIGIFLLQILGQLQFYGHPSLIIAQVQIHSPKTALTTVLISS